ncbi:MAG: glycosyltransferase family 2 protein [Proteobacteria bacterium]|nr:glycosyltransferase family 2 protein [Pseudomonadota bacterium]
MTQIPGLSIFIPVFNEESLIESHIQILATHLETLGLPFEIIIGSNGSTDRTCAILESLEKKRPYVRFFHLPRKGVGRAFALGVKIASFDRIITVDMDLSIDLSFIETAYHLLSRVHVVVGSKKNGNQKRSLLRKAASRIFIYSAEVLLGISYSDYSIAAKAYRKSAILPYLPFLDSHTFYVVLILFSAYHDEKRIMEIPVGCHDLRKSRFNLTHEGLYKFSHLFSLCVTKRLIPGLSLYFRANT